MIRVSVLYPTTAGARFDEEYYLGHHIPLVRDALGKACLGISIDKGGSGAAPGSAPAFAYIAYLKFDSAAVFAEAFGPKAEAIMGDLPNFTDIEPTVQISDVLV